MSRRGEVPQGSMHGLSTVKELMRVREAQLMSSLSTR